MRAALVTLGILAILGGYLPTWLPFDGPSWWAWVTLRVVLQLGGCAILGWLIAESTRRGMTRSIGHHVQGALLGAAAGLMLCWAPLLDLAEGPLRLARAQPAVYVERWTMSGRPHKREEICFRDVEHRLACIAPLAPKILWVGPRVAQCEEGETMDVAVLRHLEVVVGAECRPPLWPPDPDPYEARPEEGRAGFAMLAELHANPPRVAERRAPIAALGSLSSFYTVVFGSGEDDRHAIGLIREGLARRDDVDSLSLRQRLRETYGVTE